MFKFMKFFVLLITMGSFSQAYASLLIEPSIGFNLSNKGEYEGNVQGFGDIQVDYSGKPVVIGGRIGFQRLGLMGGLDVKLHSKKEYEYKSAQLPDFTADASKRDIGLFVGYNLPILFRVWGAYYFDSRFEMDRVNDPADDKIDKGSAVALGVGYRGFPFLSFNLEYMRTSFSEAERGDGSTRNYQPNEENSMRSIILSVSMPLHF